MAYASQWDEQQALKKAWEKQAAEKKRQEAQKDYIQKRKEDEAYSRKEFGVSTGYTSGGGGGAGKSTGSSDKRGGGDPPPKGTGTIPQSGQSVREEPDYDELLREALRAQREAEAERLRKSVEQGVNTLEAQRPELQKRFEEGAREAYIQKMMAQRDLPQVMAAQGLTGGAHETSLIDLDNTYQNNVGSLQNTYQSALGDIDRDVANLRATGDISIAQNANTYAQKMFDAIEAAKLKNQKTQAKYAPSGASNAGTNDPESAMRSLLQNPYVTRAAEQYAPENQPEQFLDYVSQFFDDDQLQQLIRYYNIPDSAVRRWIGADPA